MVISRDSSLYKYLRFSFNVITRFLAKEDRPSWVAKKGLENSDFCRMMRVSLIYAPAVVLVQPISLIVVFYMMILRPIFTATEFWTALYIPGMIIGGSGFLFGVVALGGFLNWWLGKLKEQRPTVKATDAVEKKSGFTEFGSTVWWSVKSKICPIVNFK